MLKKKNSGLTRRAAGLMALEPRFMFDGAAVGEAVDTLAHTDAKAIDARSMFEAGALARPQLSQALEQVQTQVRNAALQWTDAQWMDVFGIKADDTQALQALDGVKRQIIDGSYQLQVVELDTNRMGLAMAAFSAQGPGGRATLFINSDWSTGAEQDPRMVQALIEELGHSIDAALHPQGDTVGDEGELFASQVAGQVLSQESLDRIRAEDDRGTVWMDGVAYEVEHATFNFTSAYRLAPEPSYYAEKEQESDRFYGQALGVASINDNTALGTFSGNDVVVDLKIGATTYHGWISRPIKDQGVVRGFYFWYDPQFNTFADASTDGNQDGDANDQDNLGFILVVDQSWFTAVTNGTPIHANADPNLRVFEVGSSSDRVDSALNSLALPPNSAPSATADVAGTTAGSVAAREQGYNTNTSAVVTAAVAASGNVLTNDSDSVGDVLSVTKIVSTSGQSSSVASAGNTVLAGRYGTLTISASGAYSYAANDANPAVNALLTGSLNDVFTYTVSDNKGATATANLTIVINGSNDAPVANPNYNTAKESTTLAGSGFAYTGYSASGTVAAKTDVLTNDTDVDTGDTKVVSGMSINGSATANGVTVTAGSTQLVFSGGSGFNSVAAGQEVYVKLATDAAGDNYRGLFYLNAGTYTLVSVSSISGTTTDANIVLTNTPTHYYNSATSSYVAISPTYSSLSAFLTTNPSVLFENSTATTENDNGGKTASVTSSSATGYTVVTPLSGSVTGTIAVGMTVTGTGVPANTTVSELTYSNGELSGIKISAEVTTTAGTVLTFSKTGALAQSIDGAHGSLVLRGDGSYDYTPRTDNALLTTGQSAVEVFDYTMQDTAGLQSSSKLYITVYGTGTNDPVLANDTATAVESGVAINNYTHGYANTTDAGSPATGNLLSNDKESRAAAANVIGTAYVAQAGLEGSATAPVAVDTDNSRTTTQSATITGAYGSLVINDVGAYTYTIDNSNATVQALLPGQSLTETFNYQVKNTLSPVGTSWAKLIITINGTNDAPVAVNDTPTAYAGGVTETGNLLSNDTDVDSGDTKTVIYAQKGATTTPNVAVNASSTRDSTSPVPVQIVGDYGTLKLGADGTWSYVVDSNNATVKGLLPTGTSVTDTFSYQIKDTNGAFAVAQLVVTVRGQNESPVNTLPTSVTATMNTPYAFGSAISVDDVDGNLSSVTLHVDSGVLTSTYTNAGLTVSNTGRDVVLTGSQALINSYLAALTYTPDTNFTGTDFLTIFSRDALNAYDSDGFAINVPAVRANGSVDEAALPTVGSNPGSTAEAIVDASLGLPPGQTVVTQQTGTASLGTWVVKTNGTYSYTLTSPITDVAGTNETDSFTYTVYDSYGNAVTNKVVVTIVDDVPSITTTSATANSLQVDESNFTTDATTNLASLFTFVNGADGRQSLVYSLSVSSNGVDSGVVDTATNQKVYLYLESGVVMGRVGSGNAASSTGAEAFRLSVVAGTGAVTLNQSRSLKHADASNADDAVYLAGSVLQLNATLTDNDNDASSQSVDLGGASGAISFKDDGPAAANDSDTAIEGGAVITGTLINNDAFGADGAPTANKVVAASQGGSTITVGTAFTTANGGSLTINADGTYSYTPPPSGNVSAAGLTETFSYTVQDADGDTSSASFSVQVADGDVAQYAVDDVTVNEGAGTATFTITRSGVTTGTGSVQYSTSSHTANAGADFTNVSLTTVNFAANQTTAQVTVSITNDSVYEGSEDFYVNLSNPTAGAQILDVQGVGTILDDGTGPGGSDNDKPTLTISDATVEEGSTLSFAATLSKASAYGEVFTLSATLGSAQADDFAAVVSTWTVVHAGGTIAVAADGSFTLPAGVTSFTIKIPTTSDDVYEGAETLTLSANAASSYITDADTAQGTITDDGTGSDGDDAGTDVDNDKPTLTISDATVEEGSTLSFAATLSKASAYGEVFTLGATLGSAQADDFAAVVSTWTVVHAGGTIAVAADGSFTLPAGVMSFTIKIPTTSDNVYEGAETLTLSANAASSYITDADTAQGTITDDGTGSDGDDAGTDVDNDKPQMTIGAVSVEEGSTAVFNVTVGEAKAPYTVTFGTSVSGQSASAGDIGSTLVVKAGTTVIAPNQDGSYTVPAGVTALTVSVVTTDDNVYEGAETFLLKGKTEFMVSDTSGTGTIYDDGAAADGDDVNDAGPNQDPSASDNDKPQMTIGAVSVEEGSTAVFNVTVGEAKAPYTVTFGTSVSDQSASASDIGTTLVVKAGTTVIARNLDGSYTVPAGVTALTVSVVTTDDNVYEGAETFLLTGKTEFMGTNTSGTGTIYDDGTAADGDDVNDAGPNQDPSASDNDKPQMTIGAVSVEEGSTAVFNVTVGEAKAPYTVTFGTSVSDQSASASDIGTTLVVKAGTTVIARNLDGSYTVPAGVTALTVSVVTTDDNVYEGAETFLLTGKTEFMGTNTSGTGTIYDDGTAADGDDGNSSSDDDRPVLTVTGVDDVSEGSYSVFTVTLDKALAANTNIKLLLASGSAQLVSDLNSTTMEVVTSLSTPIGSGTSVTDGGNYLLAAGTQTFNVRVLTKGDSPAVYEGAENFKLTASFVPAALLYADRTGTNTAVRTGAAADDTSTILDDGTGKVYDGLGGNTGTPDDDRTIGVTAYGPVNEASQYAMFTVTATPNQQLDLTLQAATSGTAATRTGFTIEYSTDGINWTTYDADHKPTAPSDGKVYVRVDIRSESDTDYEISETFALKASFTSSPNINGAADTSIVDDGTGTKYGPNVNPSTGPATDTTALDDDRPKAAPPPPPAPPPAPAAPAVLLAPPPLLPPAPPGFASALQPLVQKISAPAELPLSLGDVKTSSSGYQIAVSETAPPGLSINRGVADQFVQSTEAASKISMPFDAFMHSNKDAVIKLDAKQANDTPLPKWVQFDPATGVFEVTPPKGFKGKLDLKVIARDDDGREATAIFQMFIGEQSAEQNPANRLQGRSSFSEKLRLAGKRPVTLVRVSDAAPIPAARESVVRVRAG